MPRRRARWISPRRRQRCPRSEAREGTSADAALAGPGRERQGFRRPAERRDREGHRACPARRLWRGRASEALHDARHGDGPGQDRERHRPCHPRRITGRTIPEIGTTIFRPPYTASVRRVRRPSPRRALPAAKRLPPSHAWAMSKARCSSRQGSGGGPIFSETRRKDWRERCPRGRDDAARRRRVRRVDPRQDRRSGRRRRFLPRPRLYQQVLFACRRQGALRAHAARGWLRHGRRHCGAVRPQHFVTSTTTANAAKVMQHLEFCRQVLWPELDVELVSVTEQWAQYSIAGPRCRDVLRKLVDTAFDIGDAALPRMGVAELTVCGGVPARLFRVSFSGERAYELAVPARYGDAAIRALMQAGAEFGITPYGTEALNVMRIEKGHAGGPEVNGQTTARDLGLGTMMSKDKDYIGRVLAGRPALTKPDRPILVGVKPVDPAGPLVGRVAFLPVGAPASCGARRRPSDVRCLVAEPSSRCRHRLSRLRARAHRAAHSRGRFAARSRCRMRGRLAGVHRSGRRPHPWLILRSPRALAGAAIPGRYGRVIGGERPVVLTERPDVRLCVIGARGGKGAEVADVVRSLTGLVLPPGPKRAAANGLGFVGTAPGQWLATAEGPTARDLLDKLTTALAGLATTAEQSDGKAVIAYAGSRARGACQGLLARPRSACFRSRRCRHHADRAHRLRALAGR